MLLLTGLRPTTTNIDAPDFLFKGKTFDDIGRDEELTSHLQRTYDPDGSKYGGDLSKLKNGILNDMTVRKSGMVSSAVDWFRSGSESTAQRQEANLAERLYESAPNRLFSADSTFSERAQALGAGLQGGLIGAHGEEAALNLLLSPFALMKAGVKGVRALTLAGAAEKTLASGAARELTEKLATGHVFAAGEREALEETIKKTAFTQGWRRQAAFEAGTNTALGGVGGALEAEAQQNRGIGEGATFGGVVGDALLGGAVGGVFGAAGGMLNSGRMGRELVGQAPVRELSGTGVSPIPQAAEALSATRAADEAAARAAAAAPAPAAPDTSVRDGALDMAANIRELQGLVTDVATQAGYDRGASRWGRDTLGLMSETLASVSDIDTVVSRLRSEADSLAGEGAKAGALAQAGLLRRDAVTLQRFSEMMANPEGRQQLLDADDVHPVLSQALAIIEPRLAPMMDRDAEAAASAAGLPAPPKIARAPKAPAAPAAAPAAAAPAPAATPDPAIQTQADGTQTVVQTQAPEAVNAAASEMEQLRPRFSPEDVAATADAEATLSKAGLDLGGALARVESEGGTATLVADVAKATGESRAAVQAKVGRAMGAVTKARAARDAEGQAAPAPAAAAAPAPAPEVAAAAPEVAPTAQATEQVAPPLPEPEPVAPSAAELDYRTISNAATIVGQTAHNRVLELATRISNGDVTDIDKALDDLRADPNIGALFQGISADSLSAANLAATEGHIARAAAESVSWHYSSAITPLMPNLMNVGDFDKLLGVMPGIPDAARRKISADYRSYARRALAAEIGSGGSLDPVRARYGADVIDDLLGMVGPQRAPRDAEGRLVVPESIRNQIAADVDLRAILGEATDGLEPKQAQRLGKIVRDFRKQLIETGFGGDAELLDAALRSRARDALNEVSDEAVRAANPELFRRLDAMKQEEGFFIDVRRVADADWHDLEVDAASMFPNPVVQRRLVNEHGERVPASFARRAELVSGRSVGERKSQLGGLQGVLSGTNGLGYYGPLFANVRTKAGSAAAVREAGEAAVKRASNRRMSVVIDGQTISLSEKEAKGRYFEELPQRLEAMRMNQIVGAMRSRLDGSMDEDTYAAAIERISGFLRPVSKAEEAFARSWLEAADRIAAAKALAKKQADDILAGDGADVAAKAAKLQENLAKVMAESNFGILRAVKALDAGVEPPKSKKSKGDAVVMRGRDGQNYEVIPTQHFAFGSDGQLKFLGQSIGTFTEASDGMLTLKINGEEKAIEGPNLLALGRRLKGVKAVRDVFEARKGELVKQAADLPEGATIPEVMTKTAEAAEARAEVSGSATAGLTSELRATSVSSLQVPAGYAVWMRRVGTNEFIPVRAKHKTIGDAIKDAPADAEFTLGLLPLKQNKSGEVSYRLGGVDRAVADFVPYGRDPAKTQPGVQRVLDAMDKQKDVAPEIAAAQRGPITLRDAAKIKLPDGTTLADAHTNFTASVIGQPLPGRLSELDAAIEAAERTAAELSAMTPHGVIRPVASRRTSFSGLAKAMAAAPRAELEVALDVLRRMDAGTRQLPRFFPGEATGAAAEFGGGFFRAAGGDQTFNGIGITPGNGLPAHMNVIHEVAHWAFANVLTPAEQVSFLRMMRKHYSDDGLLDYGSLDKALTSARAVEKFKGVRFGDLGNGRDPNVKSNELFAWQFTNYVMDTMRAGDRAAEEASLWQRVLGKVRGLLEHFYGKSELVEPELRALFERVLPPTPREAQYRYDSMLDTATGELVPSTSAVDKRHERALKLAEFAKKIDGLRGKLDGHLFTLSDSPSDAFAADLKEAAMHMWGLLQGQSTGSVTDTLRAALRPFELVDRRDEAGNRIIKREGRKAVLDEQGERIPLRDVRAIPGAIAHRRLFGKAGGGEVMAAVADASPLVKSLNELQAGRTEGLEAMAPDLVQDGNYAEFMATYERRFTELVNGGKSKDEADDLAWAEAEAQHGAREGTGSQWEAMTSGMSKDEKANAALRVVALQVRDLMTDAMEHLNAAVGKSGFALQRSSLASRDVPAQRVAPADAVAAKAVGEAAKKSSTKKTKVPEALKASNEDTAAAAAREAAHSGGKVEAVRGMPAGAPAPVQAVVSRVTHRDPEQKLVIDGIGYDIFNLLDIQNPTNGDIARLTGLDLEEGVEPGAPAAATEAFQEFRAMLRRVSENLTSNSAEPLNAATELAEVMSLGRFGSEFKSRDVANGVVAMLKGARNPASLPAGERRAVELMEQDDEFASAVTSILDDVKHLVAARATSAKGKAELPTAGQSPVAARVEASLTTTDGLHPLLAKRTVEQRIASLDDETAYRMAEMLGIYNDGGDLRSMLSDALHFSTGAGSLSRLDEVVTVRSLANGAENPEKPFGPAIQRLLDEIEELDNFIGVGDASSQAMADAVVRRQHTLEALRASAPELADLSDGAKPVLVSPDAILDFGKADVLTLAGVAKKYADFIEKLGSKATQKARDPKRIERITEAARTGNGAALFEEIMTALPQKRVAELMRTVGISAYGKDGRIELLDPKAARSFDELLDEAMATSAIDGEIGDAPLGGELSLRMAIEPNVKVDSLGLQQRALQKGADSMTARLVSRLTGKALPDDMGEVEKVARKFSAPVQLRTNASRIRRAGANWLADLIQPEEGAGFTDALHSALGRSLTPVLGKLDAISGRGNALKRWASDLYRNGALHKQEIPQSEAERNIARALRESNLAGLTEGERRAALDIKAWFADMLERQRAAGIPVGDIVGKQGIQAYLPQRFNNLWIRSNPTEAVSRLAKWFEREGRAPEDAKMRASKVIDRVMSDDDAQFLGGAADPVHRAAFSGELFARVLNISSKDMADLGLTDLFDNNLRGLVVSYAQTAETRIKATEAFGVRGHALETYAAIGQGGRRAAIEALTKGATGFERVAGSVATAPDAETVVSFGSNVIQPLFRDPTEAGRVVDTLLQSLKTTTNIRAKQAALTDMLVTMYEGMDPAGAAHFRPRAAAIVGGLSDFGPNGNGIDMAELAFAQKFTQRLVGHGVQLSDEMRRVQPYAQAALAFNSVSLLSLSTIASISDAAMPLIRSGDFKASMKGVAQLAKQVMGLGPEGIQAARNIGVSLDSAIHQAMQDVHGGRMGRFTNAFFLANGMTPWTNTMRNVAGVVGFESIKTAQAIAKREKAAGRTDSRAYMKNLRYLRQLGAAGLVDAPALGVMEEAVDNEMLRQAIHRFTNESVFQPGRNDIPLQYQDNPFWKLMFQFKSYPLMLGRMVKRTVKEAGAMETAENGRRVYVGDIKPLAFMATVGVGLAAGGQAVRDVISGRNEEAEDGNPRSVRDRKFSRIAQDLGFLEKDETLDDETTDSLLGWYAESLLALGALGLVGDMFYQSAKAADNGAFGRERIFSQLLGPTYGGFASALQAVEGAIDTDEESNAKERVAARQVLSRIPLVSGQKPLVEGGVDWMAGEAQE